MFEPKSDTYWTYVFFWWLEGEQKLSRASLESDLVAYYRGLSVAVGGSRRFLIDARKITAVLAPHTTTSASPAGFAPAFTGTLQTYDAFVTGRLIQLHVEVSHRYFPGSDRTWVYFSVSPRDPGVAVEAETWTRMRRIRDSFKVE